MKYPRAKYRIIETFRCDSNLWHFALTGDDRITTAKVVCFARIEYYDFEQDFITLVLILHGDIIPVDLVSGTSIGISATSVIGESPNWVKYRADEIIEYRKKMKAKREEAKRKRAEKRAATR